MSVTVPQSAAKLALDHLYERIVAETAERLDPVPVCVFGWREAPKQVNQGAGGANRVVLEPGSNGKVGDYAPAKLPGRNPNPLATLVELATLFLWGFDGTDPTDARLQYIAARRLHDVVIPICIRTFRGRWKASGPEWLKPEAARPYGAEMKVLFAVEAMVPDDLVPEAPGGTVTSVRTSMSVNGGDAAPCCGG